MRGEMGLAIKERALPFYRRCSGGQYEQPPLSHGRVFWLRSGHTLRRQLWAMGKNKGNERGAKRTFVDCTPGGLMIGARLGLDELMSMEPSMSLQPVVESHAMPPVISNGGWGSESRGRVVVHRGSLSQPRPHGRLLYPCIRGEGNPEEPKPQLVGCRQPPRIIVK